MEKISNYISYKEGIFSTTAERLGIDNTPSASILANMVNTACNVFEPLRTHFNHPISVLSFFRCPALNKAVGGASNSQHMTGEAIDLRATGIETNADLFNYIKTNLPFDQLIWEFGDDHNPSWVHVSFSRRNRKSILKATKTNGHTVYSSF